MSKRESFGKRRAQDIRCQVKKEYKQRISDLEDRVKLLEGILLKKEEKIRELKRALGGLE